MDHGFDAASTNRIVDLFGGSKATLFRHYPTKETLLLAVVSRIASDWRTAVQPESIGTDDPGEWLNAFAVMTLEWILGDGPLFVGRLGISEGHKLPAAENIFQELAGAPLHASLAQRLNQWAGSGQLRIASPDAAARMFFDLTVAGAVSRALYRVERLEGPALRAHVRDCVQLFLEGCRLR